MDIKSVAKAVVARDEDRGYSVGFELGIDPEQLDELETSGGDVDALFKLYDVAAKEVQELFGNPVQQTASSEYGVDAEFRHWVTDLRKFTDILEDNDDQSNPEDARITLSNGIEAARFHAVKGHWGTESPVYYEDWEDEFLDVE